jgi:hypothetical protein
MLVWLKCKLFGIHDWVESNRRYTNDLDDVEETCSVCEKTRQQPKW